MSNKLSGTDILFCALLLCLTMGIGAHQISTKQKEEKQKQEYQKKQQEIQHQKQLQQQLLEQQIKHKEQIRDSIVLHLDTQVDSAFWVIDSLETTHIDRLMDSVQNTQAIVRRHYIQQELERLTRNNDYQIKKAHTAAKKNHPYIDVIPDNEDVFYKFFHDSVVKVAHNKYKKNNRRIESLRQQYDALPRQDAVYKNIAHYFDSLTNHQVAQQLRHIDSLLNKKSRILSQKIR